MANTPSDYAREMCDPFLAGKLRILEEVLGEMGLQMEQIVALRSQTIFR
ncbi:MAG: hypothetical protein GQ538_06635 [Xanthomonadales bacterium]|nr:hypothetical protein [Xanthomonadales bacterium]